MRNLLNITLLTFFIVFKAHSSSFYSSQNENLYLKYMGVHKVQNKLTQDDLVDYVFSTSHFIKPENIQYLGEEIGLLQYCPGVSSSEYSSRRDSALNWLRLASTKFEKFGDMGFFNQRKFSKLLDIFTSGENIGIRDAKLMRRNWKYRNTLCPDLLNSKKLKGPRLNIMSRVPRN